MDKRIWKYIFLICCCLFFAVGIIWNVYGATNIPPNSIPYLPILKQILDRDWPEGKPISLFAGQVEQETCSSLTGKKCWNPKTELKTSREYGFGFGQLTIAYDSLGKERFNSFKEMKTIDKRLEKWQWEDRYNPNYQLQALVMKDKYNYNLMKGWKANHENKMNFVMNSYNGGYGGLVKDRILCGTKKGCDPNIWFGNVEKYSYKAKNTVSGYGKSFFEISREYVKNIRYVRSPKYEEYLQKILPIKKEDPKSWVDSILDKI